MLSIARNRERVLTFVIDYQWSQPKSVFAEERLSEVEMERWSERGRRRRSRGGDSDGARGQEQEGMRVRLLWVCFESFFSAIYVRTHGGPKRNRVHWTWFICTKTESIELDFMYKNRVHWTWFLCTKTKSSELDFWAYVDTLFISATGKIGNSSTVYSIYNPKIESSRLELLETKYV